ncbi:MAG: TonB-dependent receptor, partial [Flavobacterium sp.]|nr:TonB-dependent receptor [Flavobacterium sp.]
MGLAMGVNNLVDIFDEKYYRHLSGGILEAFGKLFYRDLKVFLYPMKDENKTVINSENLKVHPRMKELYKFFKFNGKVLDIENFNTDNLEIYSRHVLKMISKDIDGWESMLPKGIAELIKRDKLFGFSEKKELEQKN